MVTDIILLFIVLVAVIEDIHNYRISNRLIVVGIVVSFFIMVVLTCEVNIIVWIINIIFPVIVLYILFKFSMMGAGDIKLFAVIGGFIGITDNINCIVIAFLFGAVFSLVKMLIHKNLFNRLQYLANYFKSYMLTKKVSEYCDMKEIDNKCCIHFSIPIMLAVIAVRFFNVKWVV